MSLRSHLMEQGTLSHSLHTLLLPLTWFQAVSRSCWDRKGVQICVSNTLLQWSQWFVHVVWFFKLWMNPSYEICNQFWSHQQRQWHCLLSFASMLFIWNLKSETSNSRLKEWKAICVQCILVTQPCQGRCRWLVLRRKKRHTPSPTTAR